MCPYQFRTKINMLIFDSALQFPRISEPFLNSGRFKHGAHNNRGPSNYWSIYSDTDGCLSWYFFLVSVSVIGGASDFIHVGFVGYVVKDNETAVFVGEWASKKEIWSILTWYQRFEMHKVSSLRHLYLIIVVWMVASGYLFNVLGYSIGLVSVKDLWVCHYLWSVLGWYGTT